MSKIDQNKNKFTNADINGVARDFCDYADRSYIAARTLYKNECYDQFLYFAHQSVELYLKSIHIFHRIERKKINKQPRDGNHALIPLYNACEQDIPTFKNIPQRVEDFICGDISDYNAVRYPDYPLRGRFEWITELDLTVWVLRFYAHTREDSTHFARVQEIGFEKLLKNYTKDNRGHGYITGYLERVLKNKDTHEKERLNLVWRNLYFGKRSTRQVPQKRGYWSKNNMLFCGPPEWQKRVYENTKLYVIYPKPVKEYFKNL